jgi:hypothetical protein
MFCVSWKNNGLALCLKTSNMQYASLQKKINNKTTTTKTKTITTTKHKNNQKTTTTSGFSPFFNTDRYQSQLISKHKLRQYFYQYKKELPILLSHLQNTCFKNAAIHNPQMQE